MTKVFLNRLVDSNDTLHKILVGTLGLNLRSTNAILQANGLTGNLRLNELSEFKQYFLENIVLKNFRLNNIISAKRKRNIKLLLKMRSVRTFKYINYLPLNGQRTHSNGQTPKKRKTQ